MILTEEQVKNVSKLIEEKSTKDVVCYLFDEFMVEDESPEVKTAFLEGLEVGFYGGLDLVEEVMFKIIEKNHSAGNEVDK